LASVLDGCRRRLHNRGVRSLSAVALLVPLAACVVGAVPPVPLQGPPPDVVLVLVPVASADAQVPDAQSLAVGADRALRERGVSALPLDVARDLLRQSACDAAEPDAPGLLRLRQHANVDAVLAIAIERWRVSGSPLQAADWKLTWTLRSTRNGNIIWAWSDAGSWRREAAPAVDLGRAPDAEPNVKPFGSTAQAAFANESELIQALHRKAMQRLPRGRG
jgi:hypothetical protein